MSLEFLTCELSELTDKELTHLQEIIKKEQEARNNRKFTRLMAQWSSKGEGRFYECRTFQRVNQGVEGWIAVLVVFFEEQHEPFSANATTEVDSREAVFKKAVESSRLIDVAEPMELM